MKYSILTGSFGYDGINEFLRELSYGKGRTNSVRGAKMPTINKVRTKWLKMQINQILSRGNLIFFLVFKFLSKRNAFCLFDSWDKWLVTLRPG